MITEIESVNKSKLKMFLDRITNPLSGIRPAGVFGFMLMIAAYYIYKNMQVGNI
jgi:hypothetical protein